jgi:transcriptional regulator with PAS, ATPase and Fis domain
VGDLDPAAQVKLLRVLQDRSFEVLGSSQRRTVDVRIVSATHRPLADLVSRGEFREDLLYRINLIAVHLPALRERPGDIPLLAGRFLRLLAEAYGRDGLSIAPDGLAWLQAQPWPGNVRQLRQWLERAALVTPTDRLGAAELAAAAAMGPGSTPPDPLPAVGTMTLDEIEAGMVRKALRHHAGNLSRVAEALGLSRAALYRRLEKYGIRP